jgi:kynurenine formamidase
MPEKKVTEEELRIKCEKLRNWGRWGDDDEAGTLNFITPEDIVAAARLVRRGKVFSLAMPLDERGPQTGCNRRYNPIHYMIWTGADAYAGAQDHLGLRYADDAALMPLQCGTHWDALSHVFYYDSMYNGYDVRLVDARGAQKCGIDKVCDRMVGRGVLIDVARAHGVDALPDGYPIRAEELQRVAEDQGVEVRRADFVLVRTGQLGARMRSGVWGTYASGTAPGLALDTADWVHAKEIAAVACDTYAVEVRPEETEDKVRRPWHWIVIPNMGLTMGENFRLDELAEDCASDRAYEFLFVSPPLPFTGAVGSPTSPLAIK